MTNTVLIKRSSTANAIPLPGNLVAGELALNTTDGNLFYKNTSNVVTVIASNQFSSVTGNVTGGNVLTVGLVSATGNVYGNAILSNNYYYANGTPVPPGVIYTAAGIIQSNRSVVRYCQ